MISQVDALSSKSGRRLRAVDFCRNVVSSGTKMADEVLDRESEVFMAKLTEQAERYEGR